MEWNTKEQNIFDEMTSNSAKYAFAFLTDRGEEMFSDDVKADEEIDYFALDGEISAFFRNEMLRGWLSIENMDHVANVEKLSNMGMNPEQFCLADGRDAYTSGVMFGHKIHEMIEASWR